MILRILAFFVLAAGLLSLLVSCGMDVTVATSNGGHVMNLSLIARQASLERWGFGLLVVGLLLWIAGRRYRDESSPEKPHQGHSWLGTNADQTRETEIQAEDRRRRERAFYDKT